MQLTSEVYVGAAATAARCAISDMVGSAIVWKIQIIAARLSYDTPESQALQ